MNLFQDSGETIDIVRFESPLNIRVLMKIGASDETVTLLRGAIGVLEAATAKAGIGDVAAISVQDARKHFLGQATFKKNKAGKSPAKDYVLRQCEILGYKVSTDHEADAVAIFSYASALLNPRLAVLTTPLFGNT
jgi:hypothetical protein